MGVETGIDGRGVGAPAQQGYTAAINRAPLSSRIWRDLLLVAARQFLPEGSMHA